MMIKMMMVLMIMMLLFLLILLVRYDHEESMQGVGTI